MINNSMMVRTGIPCEGGCNGDADKEYNGKWYCWECLDDVIKTSIPFGPHGGVIDRK